MTQNPHDLSLSEVHGSVDPGQKKGRWQKFIAFLGPAYLVSVGYMDPGNWATDLAGGSKYGYSLIWVLLMSNLMALLLQSLAALLGIVRKRDLAQANREHYPKAVNFVLYVLAEIAIAATDLAEVLGMAIGLHLLFDIPILTGVFITLLDTFLLLFLQRFGMRKMELFIIGLIAIIGMSFLYNLVLAHPSIHEIAEGFIPGFPNAKDLYAKKGITAALPKETALYLAIGIIGATVMPHNLYLHSALVQTRKIEPDRKSIRRAIRINFFDSLIALNLAFLVNAGILILSATVFFKSGQTHVASIEDAHLLLNGMLNSEWAPKLFAIALICAGQSSTITGTLAGQIVMEGYLKIRLNPWVRRLVTRFIAIVPAVVTILISGDKDLDALLVFSQVVLSLQLGFAIIPLIHFVSDKRAMGEFVIKNWVKVLAWIVAGILVYLNLNLLWEQLHSYLVDETASGFGKTIATISCVFIVGLLLYITTYSWVNRRLRQHSISMHTGVKDLQLGGLSVAPQKGIQFHHIALALDFSEHDETVIHHALAQGGRDAGYLLIHIVESAPAKYLGSETADFETAEDKVQLESYAAQLAQAGYQVKTAVGFRDRSTEIARLVHESGASLLVIGSHGHRGLKDWLYGETVNKVRHEVNIPVLVVKKKRGG